MNCNRACSVGWSLLFLYCFRLGVESRGACLCGNVGVSDHLRDKVLKQGQGLTG